VNERALQLTQRSNGGRISAYIITIIARSCEGFILFIVITLTCSI